MNELYYIFIVKNDKQNNKSDKQNNVCAYVGSLISKMLIFLYDGGFFLWASKKISSAICSCHIFLLTLHWNLLTLDVVAPASSGVGVFSFILPHLLSEPHLPQTDRIDNDCQLDGTESCLYFISSFLSLFTMFTMFTA